MSPFCEGIDDLSIEYWATQRNGVALPENVFFYPDTRQFRFNSNNFAQEGMLEMEMIGAIDYYIVPTECGYEELTYYYHLDIAKKKKKKKSGSSSRRRRNLRKLDSAEEREYFDLDSDATASESDEDAQDAEAADDTQGDSDYLEGLDDESSEEIEDDEEGDRRMLSSNKKKRNNCN